MRLPRWFARIVAALLGYFWLPCPRCGRMFAGFEYRGSIPNDRGCFSVTCCPPFDRGFIKTRWGDIPYTRSIEMGFADEPSDGSQT